MLALIRINFLQVLLQFKQEGSSLTFLDVCPHLLNFGHLSRVLQLLEYKTQVLSGRLMLPVKKVFEQTTVAIFGLPVNRIALLVLDAPKRVSLPVTCLVLRLKQVEVQVNKLVADLSEVFVLIDLDKALDLHRIDCFRSEEILDVL